MSRILPTPFVFISGYANTENVFYYLIIIVPEEGWFGRPKYSTPTKKSFYVVSTSSFLSP